MQALDIPACETVHLWMFLPLKGTWVWTDGSAWDYSDWGPGEPNNVNGENCLAIGEIEGYFRDSFDDYFRDDNCIYPRPFVCKI